MLNQVAERREAASEADGIKRQVRAWWNARPCGSTVSQHEVGSRAFFEEVERHRYAQEYHIPQVVNFPAWAGKDVLEIGCGMGTDLVQFARAGARVTGIDLTPRSVEITRQRFALYALPGKFQTADAENLPFAEESFDLVYSHGVLHHTPDTQKAVDEVYRVLKPGGTAIVMLYNKHSYNYWINIRVLRALAFAAIRRGFRVETLSRITGVNPELLREYEKVIRGKSEWTLQELVNQNTDGPGNPLSKVFSRSEARKMFRRFRRVENRVYWLVKKNIPLIGKWIPRPIDYALGRMAGWELYTIATK